MGQFSSTLTIYQHLDESPGQRRGTVSRNRRKSTGSHWRAPHPRLVLLMLLLAIELCEGGEHASNFTNSEREYKHKYFQKYEKTGSTLGLLVEFRRFPHGATQDGCQNDHS